VSVGREDAGQKGIALPRGRALAAGLLGQARRARQGWHHAAFRGAQAFSVAAAAVTAPASPLVTVWMSLGRWLGAEQEGNLSESGLKQ
jgi:hypothetical protein